MIKKNKFGVVFFLILFSCIHNSDIIDTYLKEKSEFENIAVIFGNQNKIETLIVWSDKYFRIDTNKYTVFIKITRYINSRNFYCLNYKTDQENYFNSKIELFNFINIKESDYKQFFDFLIKNKIGGIQKNFYDNEIIEFIEGDKYMMHNNGLCYSPKLELDKLSSSELKKYQYTSVKKTNNQNWYSYYSI